MPLGASVYKMVIDTSQLVQGVTVSRRELKLQRDLLESTRGPMDRYGDALDNIRNQLMKGLITIEQHNELNRQLKAELPQNVAAEEAYTAAMKEGEAARRSMMSATDQLAESEKRLADAQKGVVQLQKEGIITAEEGGRRLSALQANAPGVIQAEKERADAIARGKAITEQWLPVSMRAKNELAEVRAHHLAGRVPLEAYRNAQIQLTAAQLTGIPVVGRMAGALAGIPPILLPVAAGIAAVTVGYRVVSGAISFATDKITEQYKEMDELINRASNLNIPIGQFQAMAHAADRADIEAEEFSKGFETMLANVSKASQGNKKSLLPFEMIGEDAKRLRDQQPEDILQRVTAGLERMDNAADRIRAAKGIFGDADFLRLNLSDLERANEILDDTRGRLSELDKQNLSQLDDAAKDLQFTFDSMWNRVAADLAPALTDAANAATDLLREAAKDQTFIDTMQKATDTMHGFVLVATEVPNVLQSWVGAIEIANPKLALMANLASRILEPIAGMGEVARQDSDLESQLSTSRVRHGIGTDADKARQEASLSPAARAEKEAAESVEQLNEKLREQIATFGMSSHAAEAYRVTQALVGEGAAAAAKELDNNIAKLDEMERAKRVTETIDSLSASFTDQQMQLRLSARAYQEWKMEQQGIEPVIRSQLMAQYDSIEAYKADAKVKADAAAEDRRRQDAIASTISGLEEQSIKLRMSERDYLDYTLAQQGADAAQRAAALSVFDSNKAFEKQRDAAKLATDKIEDLQKKLRQFGMSAEERTADDLKVAGVEDSQSKLIVGLQKELALRESIHQQVDATSSVIKAGTREHADAISRANQAAVRQNFLNRRLGEPSVVSDPATGMTATAMPVPPVVSGVKPVIVPATVAEQVKLQQTANSYLKTMAEKELKIEVEEVTL